MFILTISDEDLQAILPVLHDSLNYDLQKTKAQGHFCNFLFHLVTSEGRSKPSVELEDCHCSSSEIWGRLTRLLLVLGQHQA